MKKIMKKLNKKGFTLAELLIVVAIIAVLVAISIPIFSSQLEKSREAVDKANVRAAYAEVVADYLADDQSSHSAKVKAQQKQSGWQGENFTLNTRVDGSESAVNVSAKTSGSYTVKVSKSGKITVS